MAIVETMGSTVTIGGVEIYGVGDISGPAINREVIDITNHSSPGGARERRATLLDYGEFSFPITAVDPADAGIQAAYDAIIDNSDETMVVTLPDGTSYSFSGRVTAFELEAPVEGVLNGNMTLTPLSAPTVSWSS